MTLIHANNESDSTQPFNYLNLLNSISHALPEFIQIQSYLCNMRTMEAYRMLAADLQSIYNKSEAENIADWVLEKITGKKRLQRRTENLPLIAEQLQQFENYKKELLDNKPVQYVLNEAFFCGYRFILNENVLIPRPETEELVMLIVNELRSKGSISILDIGTGSGCIPISLKLKLPATQITSIDVSESAIETAKENAQNLDAQIDFKTLDFLDESNWQFEETFDVIVSNPPYIPIKEKQLLDKNVTDFEPEVALFVPDNDPFIFYKRIQDFALSHLNQDGTIYLEVHEQYAAEVCSIFQFAFTDCHIIKDMYGKERMVKCGKKS